MSVRRRTLGVIAALGASVGTLAVTASAQAAGQPDPPAITSVAVSGGTDLTTDGAGNFYTNDPVDSGTGQTTDAFTVTVHGDPNASEIDFDDADGQQTSAPDINGDAPFTMSTLQQYPTYHSIVALQTVGGQPSDGTQDTVFVSTVPVTSVPQDDILQTDATLSVGSAIPGDAVKLSGDAPDITVTADSSGTANFPAADFSADYHTVYAQTVDGQANASDTYRPVSFYVAPPRPDLPDARV